MRIIRNLAVRVWRRILDIPTRGLPKLTRIDAFDAENGTDTAGLVWLTNPRDRDFSSGVRYEPCKPDLCELAITESAIDPREFCFVDIGCGKGRPLIIAHRYGFGRLIGIEYSARLCRVARRNLDHHRIPGEIICCNATDFDYPHANIFAFLYHPFGVEVLGRVLERLRRVTHSHELVIAYEGKAGSAIPAIEWLDGQIVHRELRLFRKRAN